MIQSLFKGISKNNYLQKLVVTHDSLVLASLTEFSNIGDALKNNSSLRVIDFSKQSVLDDNIVFHGEITNGLFRST